MTPESNKTLGGLGGILLFIGMIPVSYIWILALVGFILILVALYGFANIYKERGIFNNFVYGIIISIVGAVIAGVVAFVVVLTTLTTLLYQIYPGWNGDWLALSGLTPDISSITASDVLPLLGGLVSVFLILCIAIIIAAFFARRSFNTLSAKTGVGLFSTGALLLFIGAILTIVIVGLLLMWVSALLIAIAFFQIKAQPQQPITTIASPPTPPPV